MSEAEVLKPENGKQTYKQDEWAPAEARQETGSAPKASRLSKGTFSSWRVASVRESR